MTIRCVCVCVCVSVSTVVPSPVLSEVNKLETAVSPNLPSPNRAYSGPINAREPCHPERHLNTKETVPTKNAVPHGL